MIGNTWQVITSTLLLRQDINQLRTMHYLIMTQKTIEIKNEPWILMGLAPLTLVDIMQRRGRKGEDNHGRSF
jgi:hypothetical protein